MSAHGLIATSAFGSVNGLFHSTAFQVARNLALLLAVVFWLGLAYWVYRDARRRIDDSWLVGTATVLGLAVPYLGPIVYMLFRPPETLDDVRAREIELRVLEERLLRHAPHCPVCRAEVEAGFLVCPVCTTQLKQPCVRCACALEPSWQACPYCATPVVATPGRLVAPDLVAPDLDRALTAEVNGNGNGKPPARPRRTRATRS